MDSDSGRQLSKRLTTRLVGLCLCFLVGVGTIWSGPHGSVLGEARADDDRDFGDRDDDRDDRSSRDSGGDDKASSDSRAADSRAQDTRAQDTRPQAQERGLDLDFERAEVLVSGITPDQLATLQREGYQVIEQRSIEHLGQMLVRLKLPRGTTPEEALARIRTRKFGDRSDRNHFYRLNGDCKGPRCEHKVMLAWPDAAKSCNKTVTIGMIDTGIDAKHAALANQLIEVHAVRGTDRAPSSPVHGTAVASVLVGAANSVAPGLVPGTKLIAVDAFHRADRAEDRMDTFDLIGAIDVLLKRGARVINFSFAGPANTVLDQSLAIVHKRGVVTVAAVGNDGPNAPPRYPAAHPEVIAVTGVDKAMNVYRRAGRGTHVMIAAPGVDILAADAAQSASNKVSAKTGTSFAAPYVTAAVSMLRAHSNDVTLSTLTQRLLKATKDIGAPGFDPVFGHGLLQIGRLCP